MPVSLSNLEIGKTYERRYLAKSWGYNGYQAISRGVVTPSGTKHIILFVTKKKQETLTQYNDYIDGDILYWEGEEKHGSDNRILNASKTSDEIHLFYREVHHSPFVYHGRIFLRRANILMDAPSQFLFTIGSAVVPLDSIDDIEAHTGELKGLDRTEQESIVRSRLGQGIFRQRLIAYWGGCSVTGLENISLLRASHIKPWRFSTNEERLDTMNGLLLLPTLDHLFDTGFITFENDQTIRLSPQLSKRDIALLNLSSSSRLRRAPERLMNYLKFHRMKIFRDY